VRTRKRVAVIGVVVVLVALVSLGLHWVTGESGPRRVTWDSWEVTDIPDVTRPATLRLTRTDPPPWVGFVSGFSVCVTGHIDGEAKVRAENREPKRLSGEVNWQVYYDWFHPDCALNYQPAQVRGGNLTVRYRFH
jgi:hypothetical protein